LRLNLASQIRMPDDVYARDGPLAYTDPAGLDTLSMDRDSSTAASLSQAAGVVGCEGRASQVYELANTHAALWGGSRPPFRYAARSAPPSPPLRACSVVAWGWRR